MRPRQAAGALVFVAAAALAGCSVGPDYVKPAAPVPAAYKELKGWARATPRDEAPRGPWWSLFRDPVLSRLEEQVEISNQTLRQAEAAYRQSVALVKQAQASLYPTIAATDNLTRSQTAASRAAGMSTVSTTSTLEGTASWTLDLWGRIRRQVESDAAAAQASAADIANARLAAQAQLAIAYFDLRAADSLKDLLDRTAAEYRKTYEITQNRYGAGTVGKADVVKALAQLRTAESAAINVGIARAQDEHAIAVLVGKPPSALGIASARLAGAPPPPPPGLPSQLLERRPDIAAAERTMAARNAAIGVAVAGFYPDVSLSAAAGWAGRGINPISAANEIWSLGVAASQTLFNGGLTLAQVASATAGYDAAVASYRQTVLTAFQQVEDDLASLRILATQAKVQDEAVSASQQAVDITLNEYRAGTAAFTDVITAQATLLSNQQSALTIRQNRFTGTVNLIEALGGGWTDRLLPSEAAIEEAPTPPATSPDIVSEVFTPKPHL